MNSKIEMKTPQQVEIVEVIHVRAARGKGTEEDPVRIVNQYWAKEGQLLAESDELSLRSIASIAPEGKD